MNIKIGKGGSGSVNSTKNGSGKLNEKKYIDLLPAKNNLTFLFDPIFYKNQIIDGALGNRPSNNGSDPIYLQENRDYQFQNSIPNLGFHPLTLQLIPGVPRLTKKAEIKNNMYSYIKYSDNSDVEFQNFRKSYRSMSAANPPKDNRKHFLILKKNDNSDLYTGSTSTLNFFIRLQRPVSHKNPNTGYIVREKRGTFLTAYEDSDNHISFGYRSPYYNIVGRPSYKSVFNNFSFVFSFGKSFGSTYFNRPINYTLMTDYKFNFAEVYFISVVKDSGNVKIYINGEQQTVAFVPFNPLINRTKAGSNRRYYSQRRDQSPVGPGFYKKDGSIYSPTNTVFSNCPSPNLNYLLFGHSKMNGVAYQYGYSQSLKRKRHLNNLDIGVITSYTIALSQSQISEIYNNFRYRYI